MTNKKNKKINLTLMLLVVAVTLAVWSGQARAVVTTVSCSTGMNQTTDTDLDGFTDYAECYAGIYLTVYLPDNTTQLYGSQSSSSAPPASIILDPNKKDLFVILIPSSNATYPSVFQLLSSPFNGDSTLNPLSFINATATSTTTGGLGIATHLINENQTLPTPLPACPAVDRCVSSAQSAVRVTEVLTNDTSNVVGSSNYGTPNNMDGAIVYSVRIRNFINSLCPAGTTCIDYYNSNTAATVDDLIRRYVKHTLSHEIGHTTGLTSVFDSRYGGNHYKTGTNDVMDQSVYYASKGGKVTFYVSGDYPDVDRSTVKLR